ncbi:MAG: RluA family pseudouridine synthase, partial [Clostridia bacterium]|nr:RluA family pseudouridine synthase [Clostridia bacterium]
GKIYKEYMAVCEGIYEGEGVIDRPIYRPDPIKTYRTVDERGEVAITNWKALSNHNGRTLLRIHLLTGRTHQIRVHFSSLGTPLVGDTMYGTPRDDISRQALHCCYCKFTHPITKELIEIESELPPDIAQFITK